MPSPEDLHLDSVRLDQQVAIDQLEEIELLSDLMIAASSTRRGRLSAQEIDALLGLRAWGLAVEDRQRGVLIPQQADQP